MTINLQRFCATEADQREHLRKPWRVGKWVFATNGHFAVRVPASDYPDVDDGLPGKHPDVGAMFDKYLDGREFLLMPPLPDVTDCSACGGQGWVFARKCGDCVDGEFTHGEWEYDCKNCQGSAAGPGWIKVDGDSNGAEKRICDMCDGLGKPLGSNGASQIGDAHYMNVYLHIFAALPQCRICPGSPARENYDAPKEVPAVFLFDGGHGVLMPCWP